MGNHGHSGEGIRLTCEWIWAGAIGQVREVHAWTNAGGYGKMKERPPDTPPVPKELNWDLWLGPAPVRPYHPAYHPGIWRGWHDFGTGVCGDFACHHIDPAFWALKLGYPLSIEVSRFRPGVETFPDVSLMHFQFAAREGMPLVQLHWYEGGLMPPTPEELEPGRSLSRDGHGILFIGDKGKMVCGGWGGSPRLIPESAMKSFVLPPKTLPRVKGHFRDWLDACKGGKPASANFEEVGVLVESVLMGVIASRVGGKLYWDGPNHRCTNVAAANDLVKLPAREGWGI
jgi:predicted dehydrogenase